MSGTDVVPALEMTDVRVSFRVGGPQLTGHRPMLHAVNGVDLTIAPGETLGLLGESGSGKTTLGQAALGLVPSTGRIAFEGQPINALSAEELRPLRSRMQAIFQDPYGSLNPRQRVRSVLAEALVVHRIVPRSGRGHRIRELLEMVGLRPEHADRYPHQLSGGQRQRVAIARALAVEPTFIVCDEPLSALDVSVQAQVLNLLVELRARLGLTYLFIGHDLAIMRYVSDRIAVMYLGRLVEIGSPDSMFSGAAHPYTRALVSALPLPDPESERHRQRVVLQGDLPSPIAPPTGCAFHTRCWLYQQLDRPEQCHSEVPQLRPAPTGNQSACHFADDLVGRSVGVVVEQQLRARHVPVEVPPSAAEITVYHDPEGEPRP